MVAVTQNKCKRYMLDKHTEAAGGHVAKLPTSFSPLTLSLLAPPLSVAWSQRAPSSLVAQPVKCGATVMLSSSSFIGISMPVPDSGISLQSKGARND